MSMKPSTDGPFIELPRKTVAEIFTRFHERRIGATMGHIFRTQIEIARFVEYERDVSKSIDSKAAEMLLKAFRVMLSEPEMHLLIYYGLRDEKDNTLVKLIDRYASSAQSHQTGHGVPVLPFVTPCKLRRPEDQTRHDRPLAEFF